VPIRIDSTTISTVVTCTRCPYWYAFTWSRGEGWDAAGRHEGIVHPDEFTTRNMAAQYHRRHPA
jgi:hypothetical protein